MLTLTTPVEMPPVVAVRIQNISIAADQRVITVVVELTSKDGLVYGKHHLLIRSGQCVGLRTKGMPTCFLDIVETFVTDTPVTEGYEQAVAALVSNQTVGLEQWMADNKLLPEGKVA